MSQDVSGPHKNKTSLRAIETHLHCLYLVLYCKLIYHILAVCLGGMPGRPGKHRRAELILFLCYDRCLSPSASKFCNATRLFSGRTIKIAVLLLSNGDNCQIRALLGVEPERPENPHSDPMSMQCDERNRTAISWAHSLHTAHTLIQGKGFCIHLWWISAYPPADGAKYIPNCIITYCRVFNPRGRRFSALPPPI